jgi:hypothetical protein
VFHFEGSLSKFAHQVQLLYNFFCLHSPEFCKAPWKMLRLLRDVFGMLKEYVALITLDILFTCLHRGVEHCFNKHHRQHGINTRVGYCGGDTEHPLYPEVKKDITGHAESIEITFDPTKVEYAELVEFFYKMHDPTTLNYQGPDVGSQCKPTFS